MIQTVNLSAALDGVTEHWSPKVVGRVNDQYVKVAKVHGQLAWHKHDGEDKLFQVVRGRLRIQGVVQIRVTPKTRNPLTIRALSISGVAWKLHFLNHAAPCPGCRGHPVRDGPASSHADNSSDVPGRARRCGPFPFGIALTSPSMPCSWTGGLCSGKNIPRLSKVGLTNSAKIYKLS